ncbi:hypothetical protein WJX82_008152 [Trebouxia sp. C0006]
MLLPQKTPKVCAVDDLQTERTRKLDVAVGLVGLPSNYAKDTLRPALLITVVGPSVRAFGMCVDANATVVCEPLTSAMDMLLIPHLPDSFAALASMFEAMPQLVRDLHRVSGSTFYPVTLNAQTILWPAGVGPGQPLQQKHDLELLKLQVNPALFAAGTSWRKMFPNGVQVSDMELGF